MVVNGRPLKSANRRVTADLHDFLTFPARGGGGDGTERRGDGIPAGPFRTCVKSFLARYCRLPPPPSAILSPLSAASSDLLTWRVAFRIGDGEVGSAGDGIVEMDVVEEDVARSRSVYCDQCRVVGWSEHPVCGKRYHFIIRSDSSPISGYKQPCKRCGSVLHMLDSRCHSCKYEMTVEDFEDWAYLQLDDITHLLHGVVHANGYGHLLRVNGREGGSKCLTGCNIMGFWDRLCRMLHVRKVTVMDLSKKYGMEYRLLHAVTDGHPWYGDWGYEFGAGSFALTAEAYTKAVETLSNTPLSLFYSQARSPRTALQNTISLYWSLSDRQLETVRDLFLYIAKLLNEAHAESKTVTTLTKKPMEASNVLCTWTKDDVEKVQEKMVKILRVVGRSRWVTWKSLRGALSYTASSSELLDYCLKDLGGKVMDGMFVSVRCDPETSTIEYRADAIWDHRQPIEIQNKPKPEQLRRDMKFLYDALLNPVTMPEYMPRVMQEYAVASATKLLDCKQFIKHYDGLILDLPKLASPFSLKVLCHAELVDQPKDYTAPPELIVLPVYATVAHLKSAATRAFQETYLIFQKFQVDELLGYQHVNDTTSIQFLLGSNGVVRVRGRSQVDERRVGQFRRERGLENWLVDCPCGTKDDDGERMLACDSCAVWQHTRCAGISDFEAVPVKFVCKKCSRKRRISDGSEIYGEFTTNKRCKSEVNASSSINGGRMMTVG